MFEGSRGNNKNDSDAKRSLLSKVRKALGIPKNLKQMTAGNVFDNYWRVNVWTEEPVAGEYSNLYTYKIKHSYFIKYDKELDRIIYSDPEIELTY
tara:strand:- start:1974 stop:2258 length:285 start_codon:yes stop_codon:yes gene_type:complete